MLKGFITLICILVIGFFVIRMTTPEAYTVLTQKAHLAYEDAIGFFSTAESDKPVDIDSTDTQETPPGLSVSEIITVTNKARTENGLPALKENAKLDKSALLKAQDMIANQYFEHTSPSGVGVSDLGDTVGYTYIVMGENLALGDFASADELLEAWMNSPGHRANILNKNYADIGVAAVTGVYQGRTEVFAVQHFGTPKIVCPTIDENLKDQIATLTDTLALQQKGIESAREKILAESEESPTYAADVAAFNKTVDGYNKLIALQKEKIAAYNKEVVAFNKCLSQFQKK